MSTVKSAGSSCTVSSPCGSAEADVDGVAAAGDGSDPQAVAAPAAATSTAAAAPRRRRSAALTVVLHIDVRADHGEGLVQLDVDLPAIVEGHLYLVVALLVTHLGAGDPAAPRLGQRRVLGALQRVAGDPGVRPLGGVLVG